MKKNIEYQTWVKEYLRGYSNADAKVEDLKKIYFDSLNGTTIDDADQ